MHIKQVLAILIITFLLSLLAILYINNRKLRNNNVSLKSEISRIKQEQIDNVALKDKQLIEAVARFCSDNFTPYNDKMKCLDVLGVLK